MERRKLANIQFSPADEMVIDFELAMNLHGFCLHAEQVFLGRSHQKSILHHLVWGHNISTFTAWILMIDWRRNYPIKNWVTKQTSGYMPKHFAMDDLIG